MSYRYGCGYGVGAGPSRTPEIIWDARLDLLPLSTTANASELRAALTAMGLTLTRASSATVQTSASEVVTSGIGVDDPRVGDGGYGRGLVIEESRQNVAVQLTSWSPGSGGVPNPGAPAVIAGATGPDSGATRKITLPAVSGTGYSLLYTGTAPVLTAAPYVMSGWFRGDVGGEEVYITATPNGVQYPGTKSTGVLSTAWQRVASAAFTATATGWYLQQGVDLRDAAQSAKIAQAVHTTLPQVELGKFATEAIITTGAAATRAADSLGLSSAQRIVRGGRVRLEFDFVPKGSPTTSNAGTQAFFSCNTLGALFYVNPAGYIVAQDNSGGVTATGPAVWLPGEQVSAYLEFGGGPPVFMYRRNGGAKTPITFNAGSNLAITGTIGTFFGGPSASYPLSVWAQRVRAYAPGRRPAWAA